MAGRTTPFSRPMRNSALAMAAPVLPALTMARAFPSRTASAARTREESFLRRTEDAGSSSIAMTSEAGSTSSPPVSPSCSGGPTSTTGMPSSSTALSGAGHDLTRRVVAAHGVQRDREPAGG